MFKMSTCNLHNFQHFQSNIHWSASATPQVSSEDGTWRGLAWDAAIWAGPFFQRVKGHSVFHAALSCASSGFEISNGGHRHQQRAISLAAGRKWTSCGLRVFACGVSFSQPKWGRLHLSFFSLIGDSHRDAVSVSNRNTCSNCSLRPSRMILLNCARWCACRWWLLCMVGPGFGFQEENVKWLVPYLCLTLLPTWFCYINCSPICAWQPSFLHELFPNFTPLTQIEDTARNSLYLEQYLIYISSCRTSRALFLHKSARRTASHWCPSTKLKARSAWKIWKPPRWLRSSWRPQVNASALRLLRWVGHTRLGSNSARILQSCSG